MNVPGWAKGVANELAGRLGYEIHRRPNVGGALYGPVTPKATYSPWNGDEAFLAAYRAIASHTLVDIYRCYELWSLVSQTRQLTGSIIEVGVWRGGTGTLLAERASGCGIADTAYLCDTFTGVVKASEKDSTYRGGRARRHLPDHREEAPLLAEALEREHPGGNLPGRERTVPRWGDLSPLPHRCRCLSLREGHRRVALAAARRGGIVVYDDYGFPGCSGITQHVNEQASFRTPWYYPVSAALSLLSLLAVLAGWAALAARRPGRGQGGSGAPASPRRRWIKRDRG